MLTHGKVEENPQLREMDQLSKGRFQRNLMLKQGPEFTKAVQRFDYDKEDHQALPFLKPSLRTVNWTMMALRLLTTPLLVSPWRISSRESE